MFAGTKEPADHGPLVVLVAFALLEVRAVMEVRGAAFVFEPLGLYLEHRDCRAAALRAAFETLEVRDSGVKCVEPLRNVDFPAAFTYAVLDLRFGTTCTRCRAQGYVL